MLVELLTRHGSMARLVCRLGERVTREDRGSVLLAVIPLWATGAVMCCALSEDAVVDCMAFLESLDIAFTRRQRGNDTLWATKLDGAVEDALLVKLETLEGAGKFFGARRNGLLAWTALWSASRGGEAVVGGTANGSGRACIGLVPPSREEIGHEARHDVRRVTVVVGFRSVGVAAVRDAHARLVWLPASACWRALAAEWIADGHLSR